MGQHRFDIPKPVLYRLNNAIADQGMSGESLARELGMEGTNLRAYLRGESCMNFMRFRQICEVLGVSADWILFGRK